MNFIKKLGQTILGFSLVILFLFSSCQSENTETTESQQENTQESGEIFFKLSLAQWSFHKALGIRGNEPTMDNLEFAEKAKALGFEGVEYVSAFFQDKAEDMDYLGEMKKRSDEAGIQNLLIMVDGEGDLGVYEDEAARLKNVENHYKWVDAAKFLGCHSIRVNAHGEGDKAAITEAVVKSLTQLSEYAAKKGINIIVENHGGISSDADWLAEVMETINMDNCGILPDFGNFCVETSTGKRWEGECINEFDRYEGVELFMPFAKGVSAKSHSFDDDGNETATDYKRMMQIVKDAGYTGFVGVEFEGDEVSEEEGILLTKALLEKVGRELSQK